MVEGSVKVPNIDTLFEIDPHIKFFRGDIEYRYECFIKAYESIKKVEVGGWEEFTSSYNCYGLVPLKDGSVSCKEWVPGATKVSLVGDFNNWDPEANILKSEGFGKWFGVVKAKEKNICPISHNSVVKLLIHTPDGRKLYRLSPWTKYAVQNNKNMLFESVFWNPNPKYVWKYTWPLMSGPPQKSLRIYESHVGIASEDYKVASYIEFKNKVLPHIIYLGYNTIQLMAIMEHAYYASFGYQVTSFFAVSSRYGTPEELKELIDECHRHNIRVLLDIVHSHACKNSEDGLNLFDGTSGCFFHDNGRGYHDLWDSRLFDLSQHEVQRFLISNLRWFIDEYHFDGFRFDGVTSMLYHHHGNGVGFSGEYREYFGTHVDIESITYLQLATYFLKTKYPGIVLIAEEVSGMPALCRPVDEGGIGFDYRLAMAIPDKWIKLLKEIKDDDWNMWDIVMTLVNRRHGEKHVAYAESHDQALVGDKTLAFWLMDKEMYWNMSCMQPKNIIIDRGIALHKMIRLITMGLGGEAYLTFMGNEFGHPEWLDFPRPGNNNSYHHARRQWHLVHSDHLRYRFLNEFDKHMQAYEDRHGWLSSPQAYVGKAHEDNKVISFERGGLLWVFNFHPTNSYQDYPVPVDQEGPFKMGLCTDDDIFDGYNRLDKEVMYFTEEVPNGKRRYSLKVYIPSRVGIVLEPVE